MNFEVINLHDNFEVVNGWLVMPLLLFDLNAMYHVLASNDAPDQCRSRVEQSVDMHNRARGS